MTDTLKEFVNILIMKFEPDNYKTIKLQQPIAEVLVCAFNRPEYRNALNLEMVKDIRELLLQVSQSSIKVLIFTSNHEKVFISGADIKELRDRNRYDALQKINSSLFREIEQLPIPTIAAIEGYALGGGCELSLACDLRVASHQAKFGQPEVTLGIIPGAGACYRLPQIIGVGRAKDLIFTGRIIDAEEAFQMGLFNRLVSNGMALEESINLAKKMATNSSLAIQFSKKLLNQSRELPIDSAMLLESSLQAILFDEDDKHQRMTSFLERKKK